MKRAIARVGFWILSSLLGVPSALAGDVQEIVAVGVVGLPADSAATGGTAREAAVRNALRDVVEETATALLRDEASVLPEGVDLGLDEDIDEASVLAEGAYLGVDEGVELDIDSGITLGVDEGIGVGIDEGIDSGINLGGDEVGQEAFGPFGFEEASEEPVPPAKPLRIPREFLNHALGNDPYEFVTRLQVVEDRGEQPALFSSDPDVDSEYVVVVRVSIDRDRIRERLAGAGVVLDSSKDSRRIRVRLALIGMEDYGTYQTIRRALIEDLGMSSAIPVEIEPGRFILELESNQNPSEFLEPLRRALPDHLDLIPLVVEDYAVTLQVEVRSPETLEPASPGSGPIDTPNPNRY